MKLHTTVKPAPALSKFKAFSLLFLFVLSANSIFAQCGGNQASYGNGSWIGYYYTSTSSNKFASYKGYKTESATFDRSYADLGILSDWFGDFTICSTKFNDNFAARYRMKKNFTAGCYTFTVGGDDGYRLSLDGGNTFVIDNWSSHSYETTEYTVYLSGNTNLVLEYFEGEGDSRIKFDYDVAALSSAPTSVSGNTTICAGNSTTLTATGGVAAAGTQYQWATNAGVIATSTSPSITVSPITTTYYTVRRIDSAPCAVTTGTRTVMVTVLPVSTAPTTIAGVPTSYCAGTSVTLTATGGTLATNAVYQWGTGTTAGANIIANQNSASLTISPSSTTHYWVRRYDSACGNYTSAATTAITVTAPAGNPADFGADVWNVYGYSISDINAPAAAYSGYYTQNTLGFNTETAWNVGASPSSAPNYTGCPIPVENFTFVHKRKGFPCGKYTVTMLDWDDNCIVYINGVQKWNCGSWNGANVCNGLVGTFELGPDSTIEVRTREITGNARASLSLVNTNIASTAPTAITGETTICNLTTTTLTATGGTLGTSGLYEWGTGSVGSNVISGQTGAQISVSPVSATTYWVRRKDAVCSNLTAAVSKTVNIAPQTVAGSLTTSVTTVCKNTLPSAITISGQSGSIIKWQRCNTSAFTGTVEDINLNSTQLTADLIGPMTQTTYFRAVVQNNGCAIAFTNPIGITVPATVVYDGTWSGTPNENTPILVMQNVTVSSNMNVCSCKVAGNSTMTVAAGKTLTVQNEIEVMPNANLIVENKGNLIQVDDAAVNSGAITLRRQTTAMRPTDFTYWSSPVQPFTLFDLSPATRSDKFMSFNALTNSWTIHTSGNEQMAPAKGYIVRAPQGWSLTNASAGKYTAVFNGVPNNGRISAAIEKGAGNYNLIGNPYPSAINIDLFLTDPANAGIVDGTIYLWTHNSAISSSTPGSEAFNYTSDDYAKYNLTGGVKTASAAQSGGVTPNGKIAPGQGFFIGANPALADGTYTATFNNSMRVSNNGQFFRMGESSKNATASLPEEKHRFWLNISNTGGAYDEMLVGYLDGATNGLDGKFDGATFPAGNVVGLYSILDANKLSIQGRALPFATTEVIPVGYTTTLTGMFTIALENFDGLFDDQDIILVDKNDNSYHNLKHGSYSFTTAAGTFDNRFEVRFTDGQLGTEIPVAAVSDIVVFGENGRISVQSGNDNIIEIQIFDLNGKLLATKKTDSNTAEIEVNAHSQLLLVKIKTASGNKITRKTVVR